MVQVMAHRGARSLAPENTLAAARLAFELGADLWETDVQETCDGHLVLFHDRTLCRCTNVTDVFPGRQNDPLSRFTLKELQHLDAGSFFGDTDPFGQIAGGRVPKENLDAFKKESIPTLDAALEMTRRRQWKINIELKYYPGSPHGESLPQKTVAAIEQSGIRAQNVVISSFRHSWLDWLRLHHPLIPVHALVGENDNDPLDFGDFRFDTYNVNALLVTPEQIGSLKKRGKIINLFTVNDPAAFHAFAKLGVDGLFTDFPQWFSDKARSR